MSIKSVLVFLSIISLSFSQTDVLFIGNSMTYYNNLYKVLAGLSEKLGHKLNTKAATNGGQNLIFQSTADNVVGPVKEGGYEIVILQDIVGGFDGDKLTQGAAACVKLVKQYSPNAQIVFYEPWPTKDSISGKNSLLPYFTYNYIKTAREHDAKLAPAGEAFYEILTENNLSYYCSDGKHPQPLGTLISAATIYFTIFEEDFREFTNSDQKFLDELVNNNVAYTEEGKLQTYNIDILNLIFRTGKKYADAVRKAVADKSGNTKYTSAAGEYSP